MCHKYIIQALLPMTNFQKTNYQYTLYTCPVHVLRSNLDFQQIELSFTLHQTVKHENCLTFNEQN